MRYLTVKMDWGGGVGGGTILEHPKLIECPWRPTPVSSVMHIIIYLN